jgi:hypothetical protein
VDEDTRRSQEERLRRQAGLCGSCRHLRVIVSDKGSAFAQCRLGLTGAAFAKYPLLPVLRCDGWAPQAQGPH